MSPIAGRHRRWSICSAARCRSCSTLLPASIGYIRAGQLRASGRHHGAACLDALPDLPTIGDFVPGYEASTRGTA